MKKILFFVLLMVFTLSSTMVFAGKWVAKPADPAKSENKLSEAEVTSMKNRVEEISNLDKSNMTVAEKRELRKESKEIKESVKKDGGYIYIGGSTILLIVILIIIL